MKVDYMYTKHLTPTHLRANKFYFVIRKLQNVLTTKINDFTENVIKRYVSGAWHVKFNKLFNTNTIT